MHPVNGCATIYVDLYQTFKITPRRIPRRLILQEAGMAYFFARVTIWVGLTKRSAMRSQSRVVTM
jgi:N-dimethylarginine dimethylaminohydrolase